MSDARRSYTCSVSISDEREPIVRSVSARSARRAAELVVEDVVHERGIDCEEFGVKVVDDESGQALFFDVEIEVTVYAGARLVAPEEQARRIAEHAENEAAA